MAIFYPHFGLSERLKAKRVEVQARTVGELVAWVRRQGGIEFAGEFKALTILVNGRNIRYLAGYGTPLGPKDEVAFVLPAVGG